MSRVVVQKNWIGWLGVPRRGLAETASCMSWFPAPRWRMKKLGVGADPRPYIVSVIPVTERLYRTGFVPTLLVAYVTVSFGV